MGKFWGSSALRDSAASQEQAFKWSQESSLNLGFLMGKLQNLYKKIFMIHNCLEMTLGQAHRVVSFQHTSITLASNL